ncbi:MAG TPA: ATP-binding cassette domain-containing protein [Candidatus Thermoplasmatota archaeon]|nr:ATP-binding cassette domain-containing protein [Candidatus Thermoplasmatota archaeon]
MAETSPRTMPEGVAISLRGLTKTFGDLTAVDHIDLDVKRGEIFGLLGPNGAGKTTTISMLVTIRPISDGKALVNGFDVSKEPHKVRASCGIVFQEPSIDTTLTARENLELHARLYGVPKPVRRQRIEELLALVDLKDREDSLVKTFSGGMKRRLEIARGLLHHPPIIFLDEPTLGLDPQTRQYIWQYIERLRKEMGTTFVLTTHYMEEADRLCDRIGIIDHGKIVALGTPKELKDFLGGDTVVLQMANPPLDAFKALPFVSKVDVREGAVWLSVEKATANLPRIFQAAGAEEILSVEVRRPTLEDVFIRHTGRSIRQPEADAGEGWFGQVMQYTATSNR